jgi:hypothetical protein
MKLLPSMLSPAPAALRRVASGTLGVALVCGLLGSGTFGLPENFTWHKKPNPVCDPVCAPKFKCVLHACAYTGACPPTTPGFCLKKCHSNQDCLNPDGSSSGQVCNCESGGANCTVANSASLPNIPVNVCYDPTAAN